MSTNLSDSKHERDLLNRLANLEQQARERGTVQIQGENAIQIGYTPDILHTISLAPESGLIGTFLFVLKYDNPAPESVVFGDVDIAVNKDVDSFDSTNNLSAYYGGLTVEVINDLYLEKAHYDVDGYHPVVKVVRLSTFVSSTVSTFFIHARWRYVGVGKTLTPVTGDINIVPTSA